MRILFVNVFYKPSPGGTERVVEQLGRALRQRPEVQAVGVLTTRAYYPERRIVPDWPADERLDGIDVFRRQFRPLAVRGIMHMDMGGYFSAQVGRVLRQFRPDVIHCTSLFWWAANLNVLAVSRRTPHLLSVFFHPVPRMRRTWPHYAANRWLAQRMDAVHVLTETDRRQVHAAYGAPLGRIVVIPPGVAVPDRVPDRSDRPFVTVLAVGRLQRNKGQLALLQMVQRLLVEAPQTPLRLWLVGADSGGGAPIRAFVDQHGLAERVTLFGHCSDVELARLYRQADLFALPTEYESYGLVFMEALAQGLPVVTYGVGPVPSVLTAGAVLAAPGDAAAFYAAFMRLVGDPAERQALGQEAYHFAGRLHSWPAVAAAFLHLYAQLCDRRARGRQQS